MDNDGKLPAVDTMKHYPRPLGGPEPSPLGDSRPFKDSSGAMDPGYDYSRSIPGASRSDLSRGYCNREPIADATKSDGDMPA